MQNMNLTLALVDWEQGSFPYMDWIGFAGAALLGVFLLLRLLQALTQGARYRASEMLPDAQRADLEAEIGRAEIRTRGEIAVVVVGRSDRHPAANWISGLVFLALGSALASHWMPWDQPALFFGLQLGFGALGIMLAHWLPGFRRGFVSEARASEMAEEQSLQEFFGLGLHKTSDGTGVLVFVSLLERRVIVLGDEGIDCCVDEHLWEEARSSVLEGVRSGDLKAGLTKALAQVGDVLAEAFPAEGDTTNQLPNHVIVRDE